MLAHDRPTFKHPDNQKGGPALRPAGGHTDRVGRLRRKAISRLGSHSPRPHPDHGAEQHAVRPRSGPLALAARTPTGPRSSRRGNRNAGMKRTSSSPRRSPRTRLKRERGPRSAGGRREAGALSKRVETQSSALARGGRETRPPTPLTEARNGDACPRAALWRGPRVSRHGTGHPPAGWGAAGAPRQSLL